ncbi:hypothetical protein BJX63DRAFT_183236 [Aspergillus granulosus]|uniref:TLC domain-containing protein n=1 Tax=Aspergillus granulosus TaxID=176169 RepID=A0ABR4HHN0_9EURO
MAWYSLLPAELLYVESWVVRCFCFLGLITIVPWLALLAFDMALYIWRLVTYNIPWVGGRARGMQRPRAPSLNELPDRFGLTAASEDEKATLDAGVGGGMGSSATDDGLKRRNARESET